MRHANRILGALVLTLGCGLLGYVAAYSLLLKPPGWDVFWGEPAYRWNTPHVKAFFRPIHALDRQLRPERWRTIPIFLCPSDPRPAPAALPTESG